MNKYYCPTHKLILHESKISNVYMGKGQGYKFGHTIFVRSISRGYGREIQNVICWDVIITKGG